MMAEVLDSYDKVDHSKVQFGDWEALSIHEADSRGSEDDSSQSGQERDSRSRLVRKDRDSLSTSNGDGRKDPDGPPPSYQQSGSPRKSFVTEAHVGKVDGDDCKAKFCVAVLCRWMLTTNSRCGKDSAHREHTQVLDLE